MAQQHTDIAKDSRLAEVKAGPAQTRYAATLAHGAVLSFAVMLVTYVLYVFRHNGTARASGGDAEALGAQCRGIPGGCAHP